MLCNPKLQALIAFLWLPTWGHAENGNLERIPELGESASYRNAAHGFRFDHPSTWLVADGFIVSARAPRWLITTVNNFGQGNFRLARVTERPVTGKLDQLLQNQLPEGGVYIEITQLGGGGPRKKRRSRQSIWGLSHILEQELSDEGWPNVLANPDERAEGVFTLRTYAFRKWGKRWSIAVYLRDPLDDAARNELTGLLESFAFDVFPTENTYWAIIAALQHLPKDAEPEQYYFLPSGPQHHTHSLRICDNTLVTFTRGDPRDGKPDEVWQFLVTAEGEVLPVLKAE